MYNTIYISNPDLQFQPMLLADDTSITMYHPKSNLFQYWINDAFAKL